MTESYPEKKAIEKGMNTVSSFVLNNNRMNHQFAAFKHILMLNSRLKYKVQHKSRKNNYASDEFSFSGQKNVCCNAKIRHSIQKPGC